MKEIIASLKAKRAAARAIEESKGGAWRALGAMKGFIVALAGLVLVFGGAAGAQEAREWRSPDGVLQLTIPEMWNAIPRSEPEVLIFLRSLGLGPGGPAEIVCTVERYSVPTEATFTGDQVNGLTQLGFAQMLERERSPTSSLNTVNGVLVGSYEVAGATGRLAERRFARMFQLQQAQSIARYVLMCAVRTARAGSDIDYAPTRAFLGSLQINPETVP